MEGVFFFKSGMQVQLGGPLIGWFIVCFDLSG